MPSCDIKLQEECGFRVVWIALLHCGWQAALLVCSVIDCDVQVALKMCGEKVQGNENELS